MIVLYFICYNVIPKMRLCLLFNILLIKSCSFS